MLPAIRSAATYISIALYVLLIGSPGVLIAILLGNPALLYKLGRFGVRLGLLTSGITARSKGPPTSSATAPPSTR